MPQKLMADEYECQLISGKVRYGQSFSDIWVIDICIDSENANLIRSIRFPPDEEKFKVKWTRGGKFSAEVKVTKARREKFKIELLEKDGTSNFIDCPLVKSEGAKGFDTAPCLWQLAPITRKGRPKF